MIPPESAPSTGLQQRTAVVALALAAASPLVPSSPVAGGGRTLEGWWTAQAGLALLLAAGIGGLGRGMLRASVLGGLLVLGTAAQLGVTTPLWLHYVDLRPSTLAQGTARLSVVALAVQGLVVVPAAWRRRAWIAAAARTCGSPRALAVGAAVLVLATIHASPFVRASGAVPPATAAALLVAVAGLLALNLLHVALLAESLPPDVLRAWGGRIAGLVSLPGADGAARPADRHVVPVLAAVSSLAAAAVAWAVLDRVPHIPDEVSFLFQAKCLAAGTITAPAPAVPEAFSAYMIDVRGPEWFGTANPGWPAVLALGVLSGAPWIVNPLLGGACVLLLHALVRRWSGRGEANAAALLLACSPWHLFLAASFMSHTLSLALLLGGWLLAEHAVSGRRPGAGAAAGLVLGFLASVRPLDGVVAGGSIGVWALVRTRADWRVLLPYAVGCVAGAAWFLVHNARLTGNPVLDPFNAYTDRLWYPGANRLGFGDDVGNVATGWGGLDPRPGHGVLDVLVNANQNLTNIQLEFLGWGVGSLSLVAVHVAWGRVSALDRRLLAFAGAVAAAYSLYWFSGGPDFGARYWYLAIVPCVLLTLAGARTLASVLRERLGVADAGPRVCAAVAVLVAIAWTTFVPWRAVGRYLDYRGFHADYARLAAEPRLRGALVLVTAEAVSDAASAFAVNAPTLDGEGPVFARDLGPETEARLRAAFPDRPVVRVVGRSAGGGATRVVGE